MTTLYISEYTELGSDGNGNAMLMGKEPSVTTQTVSFTTATASSAFNKATRIIRVISSGNAHLSFGAAPTATTSHAKILANTPEFFEVVPGQKVSAVDGA